MQDFAAFVENRQNAPADPSSLALKREWLKDLDSLYTQVVGFLHGFIDKGSIQYKFGKIQLNEEALGLYAVRKMDIKIGRQSVVLEPIGHCGFKSRI